MSNAISSVINNNTSDDNNRIPVSSSIGDFVSHSRLLPETISGGTSSDTPANESIPSYVNNSKPVQTKTVTNVINNKLGFIVTIVYEQTLWSDGKITTVQNTQGPPGVEIFEVGVNYDDYDLKETIKISVNHIMNIYVPKIPLIEEPVNDLVDVFNAFSINNTPKPKPKPQPVEVPHSSTTVVPFTDESSASDSSSYSEEDLEYPLCPICQTDTLQVDDDGNFQCDVCRGFFDHSFDEEEIRRRAAKRGVKLAPIIEDSSSEEEVAT